MMQEGLCIVNHYPRHIGDIAAATQGLSLAERGAYDALLDQYYAHERPLPLDRREVYRMAVAVTPAERKAVDYVLGRYFNETPGGWRQKRCDEEIAAYRDKSEKARQSAAFSVAARKSNKELRAERIAAARAKGTHTREEWLELVAACGDQCVRCGETAMPLERDHIVPIYQGGSDDIANIQPVCARCNSSKGPEAIDWRPLSVRLRFVQPQGGVELANSHKPEANSQVVSQPSASKLQKSESETPATAETRPINSTARASRLPTDWQLPEEWKLWAMKAHGLDAQKTVRISLKFRDFWISKPGKGGTKLDWFATWRNWIRTEIGDA